MGAVFGADLIRVVRLFFYFSFFIRVNCFFVFLVSFSFSSLNFPLSFSVCSHPLGPLPFRSVAPNTLTKLWNTTDVGAVQEFPGAHSSKSSACPGELVQFSTQAVQDVLGIFFSWAENSRLRYVFYVNRFSVL